ncbi:MAG TPA: arylsulfatase [Terriglobales bacterium]|nr:arylsulfatase [Terriglobales bacterium]
MNKKLIRMLPLFLGATSLMSQTKPTPVPVIHPTDADRHVLPIKRPLPESITIYDARKATPPPRFSISAPAGAPNVLIVLIDDMGFGQPSPFGGPVHMPTIEQLADAGLRYNNFHTTALCSPTRSALMTGRNHHMVNMGGITEVATAYPGNTGIIPDYAASIAKTLRDNGYSTAQFGKNHETPAWEISPSGPTDRWPTRQGFDKFYGFMGGETNQWEPAVYEDLTRIEVPHTPGYHFMTDMTNHAISWIQYEKSLTPDKPFFIYFAPGATHAPHHVPTEWSDKYKGQFDKGWDKVREETLAKQIALGVVPPGTKLAPKPAFIKDWDTLSPDEKRLYAREMEIFAGFGEYADHEIGRLIQSIKDMGQLDNTLIFFIAGDNGASAEGGASGMFNENTYFNGVVEQVPDILKHIDELGGPKSYNHYAAGWAVAGDTPFTWTKQVASSFGGTRNSMVVYWPKGIQAKNEVRSQFGHVIDVVPTILEAAKLPQPVEVDGVKQTPIEGTSLVYTFADAKAPSRHTTQYFEIVGNRAVYHDGWLAGTVHKAPWEAKPRATLENDKWELYQVTNDFSLTNDLAASQPAKLKEMQGIFVKEAIANHVLPIDDRSIERFDPAVAGRPDLMAGRTSLTVYSGMNGINENAFINTKNTTHTVTAEIEVPKETANGVLIAQGGRFSGWSFYVKDGKLAYCYNWVGFKQYIVNSDKKLLPGKATVRMEFVTDGGKLGAGGTARLFVNGEKVGEGRIPNTNGMLLSLEEGADVGADYGTPVTDVYESPFAFNGKISWVRVNISPSHLSPESQAEYDLQREKAYESRD